MIKNLVTIIGSINYDLIVKQDRMPYIGETYTGEQLITSPGGKGANQAVQCSKLNLETYMVGKIGNDDFGNTIINSMKNAGVNCDYTLKAETNTGMGIVHVMPDGNYYSTILTGANFYIKNADIDKVEHIIEKSKIVILQMEIPVEVIEHTISLASKHNCYIILNLAPPKAIHSEYLKKVNCLIVNETEASFLANTIISTPKEALANCENLYAQIKELIIITLGANGSVAYNGQEKIYMPARKVDAVDATGAGDSFIGAIAYSLYNKKSLRQALEFATYVSSISVTKIGGQISYPNLGDLSIEE